MFVEVTVLCSDIYVNQPTQKTGENTHPLDINLGVSYI